MYWWNKDDIRHEIGLIAAGIFHIMILLVPVSMNVVRMLPKEVELFVINEERRFIQDRKLQLPDKKEKKEIFRIEQKEVQKPQVIEEKPMVQEEVIEPEPVSYEKVEEAQTITDINENIPNTSLSTDLSVPHDIEFGTATGPNFLHKELPAYPMFAKRLGKEGKVILRLTLDEHGKLLSVEVVEGTGYGFTESAIEAVRKSTFLPAKVGGKPVVSRAILPLKFTLRRN